MEIVWPAWSKLINEHFVPLNECRDRYLILYGSRGSSKSDYTAKRLIFQCLTFGYFKCILYRKNYNSIKDSSYETLKQAIYDMGLESVFVFKQNPLEITCINGNKFIARGGDDPNKLKSIKDPTCVWYEEDIPDEMDFATITLTIRSTKAELLQEIFTINPQTEGEPQDNWFYKRFFQDKTELNFREKITVEVEGRLVDYYYTVHHSTYHHNRWLRDEVKAQIEDYKRTNPYLYSVYGLGLWTPKETGGNFYPAFKRAVHVVNKTYIPELPLHVSFDFNVNPYMTCLVFQARGKEIWLLDEICGKYPNNNTAGTCQLFMNRWRNHKGGVFVYGDPAGKAEGTRTEAGYNDFRIIQQHLAPLRPGMRILPKAPPVKMRGDWINAILNHNEGGLSFTINESCINTIADFSYLKVDSDGTKFKQKVKDPETGVTYEKYGHTSDSTEYYLAAAFASEFTKFQSGGNIKLPNFGKSIAKHSY